MKSIAIRLTILAAISTASSAATPSGRTRELFDFDWKFYAGDVADADRPDFEDASWQAVDLPHDWQIAGPFDQNTPDGRCSGFLPHGVGWYRKHFEVAAKLKGKQLALDFEGVYGISQVWLNGHLLGKKLNGYLGFQYDITPQVRFDGSNVVVVHCDNSAKETSRWYTGSGIYRHVWLLATDPLHVERFGTYVTTPRIESASALARITTEVRNRHPEQRLCELVTKIQDAEGRPVGEARSVVPIAPGDVFEFVQEVTIRSPLLWSPESPYLYKAVSLVREGGELRDAYETPFGVREIAMNPQEGLLVNGRKIFARGVNIHHDNGCLGAAAFDRATERRLEILKGMGCNAIRLSHNPHAPALLDMCDRMGFLVIDEAYDKWTGQYNAWAAPFEQTWKTDLREFLRRDRNHPCVFIWSVGNECVEHQINAKDHGVAQLRELVDFVHLQEPTRKVTCALFPARVDGVVYWEDTKTKGEDKDPTPMTFHMDVTSCNYMQKLFPHDRANYPQLVFLASEVATAGNGRDWFDVDKEHTVGMFYWGGIDYLGESFGWPSKGWSAGFVDWCGFRKPASYYVQSFYSDKPMVRIAVYEPPKSPGAAAGAPNEHWNWKPNTRLRLATYTNCEAVELNLNGKSLGEKKLADCKEMLMEWDVAFQPGVLRAIGRKNGQVVAEHELRTAGTPERIVLLSDRAELRADGQDLAHVTVLVTDRHGVVVPSAVSQIRFSVTGYGRNIGIDNGDTNSNEPYQANERTVLSGRALLVVRAAHQAGEITVKASAGGLAASSLKLMAKPVGD